MSQSDEEMLDEGASIQKVYVSNPGEDFKQIVRKELKDDSSINVDSSSDGANCEEIIYQLEGHLKLEIAKPTLLSTHQNHYSV